ncbi:hypothetical protein GCM10009839_07910 [Catenulispora yoronensis]|uniref:Uncharacterized protein n=1 Tax=Catenulispora yoronensis TaxID=450799 RepID=A0ABP5F2Q1_9ACTN
MNNSIIDPTTAALAAGAKYGSDMLAATTPSDADGALRLARNIVARLRISPEHGAAVVAAVADVIAERGVDGTDDGLRAAVAAALGQDADLASDIAMMLSESTI